jgi:aspartate kinase
MIVMKFGGTSVMDATAIDRTAQIVKGRLSRRPMVVVSAMAKVTDALLAAGKAAGEGQRDQALELVYCLRERHHRTAKELVTDEQYASLGPELDREFDTLNELLKGIVAVGELSPRSSDYVVSYGERLNSKIVTAAYCARGIDAVLVDARKVMVTDAQHGKAIPQAEEIEHRAKNLVRPLLDNAQVPVMGGFIGATEQGVQTTIGRGGSDFSAALIGAGLDAEAIEIWTDVNGMMTTDPRICPEARRIRVISFEEAAELAYFGAKVLHPATVLPAVQKDIPVLILNSLNPSNEGTLIVGRTPRSKSTFKAIAAKKRITIVEVVAARMLGAHGFLKAIFDVFDKHQCSIDDSNEAIPAIAADLEKIADVKYAGRNAIVCLVGENIRETPQIAARVFAALGGINVRMISQGASEINITFVINEDDVPEAIRRLHKAFFTEVDAEVFD